MSSEPITLLKGVTDPARIGTGRSGAGRAWIMLLMLLALGGGVYGLIRSGILSHDIIPQNETAATPNTQSTLGTMADELSGETAGETPPVQKVPVVQKPVTERSTKAETTERKPSSLLRKIDALSQTAPEEAKQLLVKLTESEKEPAQAAEAYYRLGYLGRKTRNEEDALGYWDRAYRTYPETVGGRLSALALGDTFFAKYCGKTPDYSRWEEVRELYSAAIGMDGASFLSRDIISRTCAKLKVLNKRLVFSNARTTDSIFHTVGHHEYLSTIAKAHGVHFHSIQRINNVHPKRISPGMKLKILKGEVTIVVQKNERDLSRPPVLTWYMNGIWMQQYSCCVGAEGKTPTGNYVITKKEVNPAWRDPQTNKKYEFGDPDNIIGTRWMAMAGENTNGLGIHGTTLPKSIPGYTSKGCVRLLNRDVEELYGFALVGKNPAKVIILP